jgi:hypothetical protein
MSEPNCFPSPDLGAPAAPLAAAAAGQQPAATDEGGYGDVWLDALAGAPPQGAAWVRQGYLARGHVTLLSSQWKMGKTTLLSVLLSRMATGGALAGLGVAPRGLVRPRGHPA